MCLPPHSSVGSLKMKSLSQGSGAGLNTYRAVKTWKGPHATSDTLWAMETRGGAPLPSSILGLTGFSHLVPERPESHSLWKPQLGWQPASKAFLGPGPLALETALVILQLQNRVSGQLRLGLGGEESNLEQGHVGASLPQLPGPQGLKCVVLSQQLLAVVGKNREVKVCGTLSLYVYVSALTWRWLCPDLRPASSEALITGSR